MAWNLGGEVQKADHREYGSADITINKFGEGAVDALFEGLGDQMRVSQKYFYLTTKIKPFSVINFIWIGLDVSCR